MQSLNHWDYSVMAVFTAVIVAVGIVCRKLNRTSSAYFRGGGNMLWWVGGVSAFSTGISAWSFTGAAGKCYLDGFVYPLMQVLAAVPALLALWIIAPRFRRIRVITAMDAVFRRFGFGTEQFYTWFILPMGLFWGGIGLNTLAVFMAGVFQLDLVPTILLFGLILTFVAVIGGQWAISFFAVVQGVLLLMMVALVVVLTLMHPAIGGLTNLPKVLPARHLDLAHGTSGLLVAAWIVWNVGFSVLMQVDLRNSGKYVRVKDDRSARRMAVVAFLPFLLLLPVFIQLPAVCASVLYPDLAAVFPQLKRPEEGAWLAMALTVLPQGLVGLMVCTIFGASADSTDAALNANAGFFTRNVYLRYVRPDASEKHQVLVAKIATTVFGFVVIGIGLMVNSLREINLFDLFQILNALLLPPMIVPMALGILFKRTPDWSGWSSVLAGLLAGLIARALFSPVQVQELLGLGRPLTPREIADAEFIFVSSATIGVSALWFLGSALFWSRANSASRSRIESLFDDLGRPVNHMAEGGENQDAMQYLIIGGISAVFGGALVLGALIPNPLTGRIGFAVLGGVLLLLGALSLRASRRAAASVRVPAPAPTHSEESR
jgi:Na+/proline symporter